MCRAHRIYNELHLQAALGAVLMATRGQAAPEVEQAYGRAQVLCEQVEETPQLFPVFRGLWNYYLVRRDMATAQQLGEKLLPLAQRLREPSLIAEAHWVRGVTLYFSGVLVEALAHLDQGMALYESQPHGGPQALQDLGVGCHGYAAEVLWHLGYPEQALRRRQKALALAQHLSHPYSIMWSQIRAVSLSYYRREAQEAQAYAEACMAGATEQGFAFWVAAATIEKGWAVAVQGQVAEGLEQLQQGIAAQKATGVPSPPSWVIAMLAEAYGHGGQPEAGLAVLDEALATSAESRYRFYEPELYRLKGELLGNADCGLRN